MGLIPFVGGGLKECAQAIIKESAQSAAEEGAQSAAKEAAQNAGKKACGSISKLKWEGKDFSKIGKNYTPDQFIEQIEQHGWVKTVEQGGGKSGTATILTNPTTGEKLRIHTSPSNGKSYFRVQNKGGNYIDDTGNFPSNATKQEVRDLTHFYFD